MTTEVISGEAGQVRLWLTAHPRALAIILPGANCAADRYGWLVSGLTAEGICCAVPLVRAEQIQLPSSGTSCGQEGKPQVRSMQLVSLADMLSAIAVLQARWPGLPLIAAGHSLGGSVILEALDPNEAAHNPRTCMPLGFAGLQGLRLGLVLGASLQPWLGTMELPYRSEDRPLACPSGTRLQFIAAQNDRLATPQAMARTAARYAQPPTLEVIAGGNHWGWVEGHEPGDGNALDGIASISGEEQQRATLLCVRRALLDALQGA